ncbi:hypothetical protein Agabi119p4_8991 [Agaricus bisporus var. burnettii]|uniref:hAT-like transposase RNase-H fold domain-containing protein n=1 Tax=Agaricus bisporus var. burnettii TaxID=192524 RepID=A0A8H7EXK2_AGABI|nr:hypothetical protein Agabi119p4_8991 [Agaricus bisporus var. burnettii]
MQRRRYLKFRCVAAHCKGRTRFVYRATFGSDRSSTSNLRVHAEGCWGKETIDAASNVEGGVAATRNLLKGWDNKLRDGTLLSFTADREQSSERETEANERGESMERGDIEADIVEGEAQDEENERGLETDNVDGWVDERDIMNGGQLAELDTNVEPARQMLSKVRKLAYAVKNSSTSHLPRWKRYCREAGLEEQILPRDMKTRWNSTYLMLVAAVDYRAVYNRLVRHDEAGLREYELSRVEWKIAEELRDVLKIFFDATSFFSMKKECHLSTVIPAMDHIDNLLTSSIVNAEYSTSINKALEMGQKTLNHYYSLTDGSSTYRIAMVLDPHFKLEYFRDAKWELEWIETARNLVHDVFNRDYINSLAVSQQLAQSTLPPSSVQTLKATNSFKRFKSAFAGQKAQPANSQSNEVNKYLKVPPEPVDDPIQWWVKREYPDPSLFKNQYPPQPMIRAHQG